MAPGIGGVLAAAAAGAEDANGEVELKRLDGNWLTILIEGLAALRGRALLAICDA